MLPKAFEDERMLARIRELHAANYYAYGYRIRLASPSVSSVPALSRTALASGIAGMNLPGTTRTRFSVSPTSYPSRTKPDIIATFSAGSRVYLDLPVFQNYFAHRNQDSETATLRLAPLNGIGGQPAVWEIVSLVPISRPQNLLLDWMDDLEFAAEYLCD